jgi:hypothetical protein
MKFKKPKQKLLPKKIFVHWEDMDGEPWVSATQTIDGIDHGTQVGIYELTEVRVKNITEELI